MHLAGRFETIGCPVLGPRAGGQYNVFSYVSHMFETDARTSANGLKPFCLIAVLAWCGAKNAPAACGTIARWNHCKVAFGTVDSFSGYGQTGGVDAGQ